MVECNRVFKATVEVYHHSSIAKYPGRWDVKTKHFLNSEDAERWVLQYDNKFFLDGKLVPVTQTWQSPKLDVRAIQIFCKEETLSPS